jgi:hypothetical protein
LGGSDARHLQEQESGAVASSSSAVATNWQRAALAIAILLLVTA